MDFLDISNKSYSRIFIIGDLYGEYQRLIDILYEQNFTYNDAVILTGNFIDIDKLSSLNCYEFLKNNENCYSVLGNFENKILKYYYENDSDKLNKLNRIFSLSNLKDFISYLESLPLCINATGLHFVVNSGVEPGIDLLDQDSDVFYNIGEYDENSRFYQQYNPTNSSWYESIIRHNGLQIYICFGNIWVKDYKIPAGYNVGRNDNDTIRCLVLDNNTLSTSLIELKTETGGYYE